jgi:hypothetical protein
MLLVDQQIGQREATRRLEIGTVPSRGAQEDVLISLHRCMIIIASAVACMEVELLNGTQISRGQSQPSLRRGRPQGRREPDQEEQTAAWEMYVELITRIAVVEIGPSQGLLREGLDSLYSLFDTTRGILRQHGPSVARAKGQGTYSFGYLAVIILNQVLRPVLAGGTPSFSTTSAADPLKADQEQAWAHNEELRAVLREIRPTLEQYAELLAEVAGVPSLLASRRAEGVG